MEKTIDKKVIFSEKNYVSCINELYVTKAMVKIRNCSTCVEGYCDKYEPVLVKQETIFGQDYFKITKIYTR